MYIENKSGCRSDPARLGQVHFSKSGRSAHYRDRTFETVKGTGFKSNHFDTESGEPYWISGCRKDRLDALYATEGEIDADVREAYWVEIRSLPDSKHISGFRAKGGNTRLDLTPAIRMPVRQAEWG
jgi:hypothetical protein